jgi:hypothetical protein
MLIQNVKVFDDYIDSSTTPVFSADRWNEPLGRCSSLGVMAVIDDVQSPGGTGALELFVTHSADNRNWFVRGLNYSGPAYSAYGDISIAGVTAGTDYVRMYSDACEGTSWLGSTVAGPLLPFVRIAIYTTVIRAHVKVYVACRGPARW